MHIGTCKHYIRDVYVGGCACKVLSCTVICSHALQLAVLPLSPSPSLSLSLALALSLSLLLSLSLSLSLLLLLFTVLQQLLYSVVLDGIVMQGSVMYTV